MDKTSTENINVFEELFNPKFITAFITDIQQSIKTDIISKSKTIEQKKCSLFKLINKLNYYYNLIGAMQFFSVVKQNELCKLEQLFHDEINIVLYKNTKIYDEVINIKEHVSSLEEKKIINSIEKKFEKSSKKMQNITDKIIEYQEKIINLLNKPSELPKIVSNRIDEKILNKIHVNPILLTKPVHNFLIKKINNSSIRNVISRLYYLDEDSVVLKIFVEIILLRHKLANENNYDSYFEYCREKYADVSVQNSHSVLSFINDLLEKINPRSLIEIKRLKYEAIKNNYNVPLTRDDILHYSSKFKIHIRLSVKNILDTLFTITEDKFKIKFTEFPNTKTMLWDKSVITYCVTYDNKKIGFCHFDLYARQNKISIPLSVIILSNKFSYGNDFQDSEVIFAGSYMSENSMIDFNEMVNLFGQFGKLIQSISANTKLGIIYYDDEFENFVPQIFEYIAWNRETLEKLKIDECLIDQILFMKRIDLALNIRLKCINSLFDHTLHASSNLIKLLGLQNSSEILVKIYRKMYEKGMKDISEYIDMKMTGISPDIIFDEINGCQGLLYGNIFSDIMSYTIFLIISEYPEAGQCFVEEILFDGINPIKHLIHNFVEKYEINSYDTYLKNILDSDEISTEMFERDDTTLSSSISNEQKLISKKNIQNKVNSYQQRIVDNCVEENQFEDNITTDDYKNKCDTTDI